MSNDTPPDEPSPTPPAAAEIAELRRLLARATPGPWRECHESGPAVNVGWVGVTPEAIAYHRRSSLAGEIPPDRELIVAMHNALPRLLEAAERLALAEAENEILRNRMAALERLGREYRDGWKKSGYTCQRLNGEYVFFPDPDHPKGEAILEPERLAKRCGLAEREADSARKFEAAVGRRGEIEQRIHADPGSERYVTEWGAAQGRVVSAAKELNAARAALASAALSAARRDGGGEPHRHLADAVRCDHEWRGQTPGSDVCVKCGHTRDRTPAGGDGRDGLLRALHDAINSPKGVVPDSALPYYNPASVGRTDDDIERELDACDAPPLSGEQLARMLKRVHAPGDLAEAEAILVDVAQILDGWRDHPDWTAHDTSVRQRITDYHLRKMAREGNASASAALAAKGAERE
jgi:hypothetical protein